MALANVVRWDPKLATGMDRKTNDRIVKIALGVDWRQAKYAARCLAFSTQSVELCANVVEVRTCSDELIGFWVLMCPSRWLKAYRIEVNCRWPR